MHELGIATRIRDVAVETANRFPGKRVTSVHLSVGQLRAIEPDMMALCWKAATRETRAEHASLEIDEIAAWGRCRACDRHFRTSELVFVCPACGGVDVETLRGTELQVDRVELD